MNITVRPAQFEDIDVIAEFNTWLAAESEGKTLDADTVHRGVAALVGDRDKGRYFLADVDGEVVGQAAVSYEWSDWREGWWWWLQSVYVRADWRGRGVFRAIFREIESAARADRVIGLRLYVERGNATGQATYRALGMSPTSYDCYEKSF